MTSASIPRLWGTILLTITIFSLSLPIYAKYSGGTGEPNNPYQIATAEDLVLLGDSSEDYDKHFILTTDIDLDPNLPGRRVFDRAVIAPDTNDLDDGIHYGFYFNGVFDGDWHTISHLTINGKQYVGLFGTLLGGWYGPGEVRNLGLVDVSITCSGDNVGGLVGHNRGTVIHCHTSGMICGYSNVGGLVGWCSPPYESRFLGQITESYSTANVTGVTSVGGLVGSNSRSYINNCYSMGAVTADHFVGGLVGANGGSVAACYSTGTISGNRHVGGLIGENSDQVTACLWDIQTSGQASSAGGTGKTTAQMQAESSFIWGTCDNEGIWTIDDGNDYPKLWWENRPGNAILSTPLSHLLIGAGSQDDPFLIYTAEELNLIGLYPCEWDKHFRLMADIDLSSYDGQDYRPSFNVIGTGTGSFISYPSAAFAGVFDGNGHTISNLTITGGRFLGLVGRLTGEVKDLGVVDVNVTGSDAYIGGLVGYSYGGTVTDCFTTGSVRGQQIVGGLVGYNWRSPFESNITNSYSNCSVTGNSCIGGLVGVNHDGALFQCYSTGAVSGTGWGAGGLVGSNGGNIVNSYSTSQVSGKQSVGGLVGSNEYNRNGVLAYCYSTGAVTGDGNDVGGLVGYNHAPIVNCFWDIQTSSQATSSGVIGKTTAEMQMAETFLEAGWDFVDEIENGTEDIWWILEGQDYPRLWWELIPEN
jgi:hypothetical protein